MSEPRQFQGLMKKTKCFALFSSNKCGLYAEVHLSEEGSALE